MGASLRLNDSEPTEAAVNALVAALIHGYEHARDELASTGHGDPVERTGADALEAPLSSGRPGSLIPQVEDRSSVCG